MLGVSGLSSFCARRRVYLETSITNAAGIPGKTLEQEPVISQAAWTTPLKKEGISDGSLYIFI
jgi:hypothetical protein